MTLCETEHHEVLDQIIPRPEQCLELSYLLTWVLWLTLTFAKTDNLGAPIKEIQAYFTES